MSVTENWLHELPNVAVAWACRREIAIRFYISQIALIDESFDPVSKI